MSSQSCPNCRADLPSASLVEGVPASESAGSTSDETNAEPHLSGDVKAVAESKLLVLVNEVKGTKQHLQLEVLCTMLH